MATDGRFTEYSTCASSFAGGKPHSGGSRMTVSKIKLTMIGGFCLLVAFFCARDIIAKSGWPQVPAEITAVTVECLMESTQHRIVYKTVSSASIP